MTTISGHKTCRIIIFPELVIIIQREKDNKDTEDKIEM